MNETSTPVEVEQQPAPVEPTGGKAGMPKWAWIVIALLALLVVGLLGVLVGRMVQSAPADPGGQATSSTPVEQSPSEVSTPQPTWDMTAQAQPNSYGSYGTWDAPEEGERWVTAMYSWEPDVEMPAWHLSKIRPWTTDRYFAEFVAEGHMPPEWEELHDRFPTREVVIKESWQSYRGATVVTVRYELVDTAPDGSQTRSGVRKIELLVDGQDTELHKPEGIKTIVEPRVDGVISKVEEGTS